MQATPAAEARAENLEPCPACGGHQDRECGICGGQGFVSRFWFVDSIDAGLAAGEPPAWMGELAEFLEARGFIERHGLLAWMQVYGEPSQALIDGLAVFEGELARLEQAERVREAMAAAARKR